MFSEGGKAPTFEGIGRNVRAIVGDTVLLPCKVHDLGSYLLAWKKGIAVLTAGNVKVSPDERLRLVNGYDLQIRQVQEADAGEYVCQIATMQPDEITHSLQILVPPHIEGLSPPEGVLEVEQGSRVQVECHASGQPQPKLSWSREGLLLNTGPRLEIDHVKRQQAGKYICTADNNVGHPATTQLLLHVLYGPEVSVGNSWVHAGVGSATNLSCTSMSYPPAKVTWYRETTPLPVSSARHSTAQVDGSVHLLQLHNVQSNDFGIYLCVAENSIGKAKATIELSGKPHRAVFQSPSEGRHKDRYNITWTVSSQTPIDEFKLLFRKASRYATPGPTARHFRRYDNVTAEQEDWNDVVLRASPKGHFSQETAFLLRGLEPATTYEALVQAKNRFGWSQISDTFYFNTRGFGSDEPESSLQPSVFSEPEVRGMGVRALESATVGSTASIPTTALVLLLYAMVLFGT
ncbi:protein amalgam-like [Lycorma delicatula]|uniref:protein amalgam-like n=1 Tax=Lycorma delicatula TaxID=130591 RepID=UPI003F50F45D